MVTSVPLKVSVISEPVKFTTSSSSSPSPLPESLAGSAVELED